ncbi:MAG: flippase-like domain-containing protein [Microthrixaceae bacterium]|nr:flippase-like domain-containing protein [Microthrixaceae bacterium]
MGGGRRVGPRDRIRVADAALGRGLRHTRHPPPLRSTPVAPACGEFVSNALPTSFGGDIVRVIRQGNDAGDYADAFAATSLERLTGWLVLPLLSFTGLALSSEYRSLGTETTVAVLVDITTLVALGTILILAGHERGAGRLVGDTGWRRYLAAVHLGILAFRHHRAQAAKVLLAGIGFQLLQVLAVVACARALDIPEIGLTAALAFFPPTAILQNIPLALGGLGVREATFVYFCRRSVSRTQMRSRWGCSCTWSSSFRASQVPRASFAVGSRGAL